MLNKNFTSTFVNNDSDELEEIISRFKDVNDIPGVMYVNENNKNIRIVRGMKNPDNCIALIKHTNNKYGHLNDVEICWASKSDDGEEYELNTVYGGNKKYNLDYVFSQVYSTKQPLEKLVKGYGGRMMYNDIYDLKIANDGVMYDIEDIIKKDCPNVKNNEHDSKRHRRVITKAIFILDVDARAYYLHHIKIFVHKICGALIMDMTLNDFEDFRDDYGLDIDHIDSDSGSSSYSNRFTNLQLVTKLANQELKICRGKFKIVSVINMK